MIKEKIILEMKNALKGLSQLGDMLRNVAGKMGLLKTVTRQGQQSLVLDTQRIASSFEIMGSIATGAMSQMIANSPALGAEVSSLTFAFDTLFMSLGNALAPVLQPFVDWLVDLTQKFRDLPAPVQQFIGLTIVLTAAISALAGGVLLLSTVSLPLIAAIIAIAAAIALILVIWNNWNSIMQWWHQKSLLVKILIIALMAIFAPFVLAIIAIIAVIKNWGTITEWLGNVWNNVKVGIGNVIDWIGKKWSKFVEWFQSLGNNLTKGTGNSFEWLKDKLKEIWDAITGFFSGAGGLISEIVEAAGLAFKGVLNSISSWLNSNIIDRLNEVINKLKSFEINNWKPFGNLPTLPQIPQFAQGAFNIPQNMLAVVHQGEMIIPRPFAEDIRRRGFGGGINISIAIQLENAVIRSENDLDDLAKKVSERMLDQLERTTSWR